MTRLGSFIIMEGKKQNIKAYFSQRLRAEDAKDGQASLVEQSVLQGVTDCLIWGGRTLKSYVKRKEPLAGEMNVLFLLLFNRLAGRQERRRLWFPSPFPARHRIHPAASLVVCRNPLRPTPPRSSDPTIRGQNSKDSPAVSSAASGR